MHFASDNSAPAHPAVIAAMSAANDGYAMGYGADMWTERAQAMLREVFEAPEAAVHFVATGTAANALALSCLCPPWAAVFCHRLSHIEEDECGAPEFYTGGAKLVLLDGANAKVTQDALSQAIGFTGRAGVHNVQPGMVSLTNATETGTVYGPGEVAELARVAHEAGLPLHLDGARLANALAATGASPAEMSWRAGVDALSFGGTKNGCMGVEAVILFDPARAWEFELRRKRGGHLFSKHRYLAAQMVGYLDAGLWLDLAAHANAMARRLSTGLAGLGAGLVYPTEANAVFAAFPRSLHRRAKAKGAAYHLWPGDQPLDGPEDETLAARFVCSWSTTAAEVDGFLDLLGG